MLSTLGNGHLGGHRPGGYTLSGRICRREYAPPPRGLATGSDQAGLVGQDDGLDAVAEVELGKYAPDVDFDSSFGQVQVVGDLTVGPSGGDLDEDGLLAVGELAEQDIPVLLPARSGYQGDELVDEPAGRRGGEDRVAASDGADSGEQLGRWRVLQEKPAGAGLEPREDVLVQVEGGKDQDLDRRVGGGDQGGRGYPVRARHPDVHQHHVRVQG